MSDDRDDRNASDDVEHNASEAAADTPAPEPDDESAALIDAFFGTEGGTVEDAEADHRSGFVALIGRPNVGKSTLLNALLGEKVAIISHRPQTTRRRLLGIRTTDDAQAVFVDTPGIHKPRDPLGRYMVGVARGAIPDADVVTWVVDVSTPPGPTDRTIAEWINGAERPVLIAMNKSDLLDPEDIKPHTAAYLDLVAADNWILTIATEGHNLDALWDMIVARLPAGPPLYPQDQITDQTERALVAELVREAALRYLQQEVPHGVEVVVEDWEVRDNDMLYIGARLLVERESHKPIAIGRGGSMLKRIGTAARKEVERLLDRRVYLDLFVSVRPDWRQREADVRRLGFE